MHDSESSEDAWIMAQRRIVSDYLCRQNIDHLGVGEYPAFHICPYVALWAVQSRTAQGRVGWWAISGDLPTDCISRRQASNPRDALRAFIQNWSSVAVCLLRGEQHLDYSFDPSEQPADLGELLQTRANILREYAEWEALWDEDGGFVPPEP